MLLSVFSALYESLVGQSSDYTEFRDHLFTYVGILTLLSAAAFAVVFYIVLGRWRSIWYNRVHWFITILLSGLVGYLLAYVISKNELGIADSYVVRFAMFNALIAAIYFILLSFACKPFSIYAKRIPF